MAGASMRRIGEKLRESKKGLRNQPPKGEEGKPRDTVPVPPLAGGISAAFKVPAALLRIQRPWRRLGSALRWHTSSAAREAWAFVPLDPVRWGWRFPRRELIGGDAKGKRAVRSQQ